MRKIDEGLFIKLLPDDGMVLTDVATETMRAAEIDLGKTTAQRITRISRLSLNLQAT